MLFDKISDSLGVENLAITPTTVVKDVEPLVELGDTSISVNITADYIKTRSNLLTLSEKLNNLIDSAINIAEASETPRAFEVAGALFKTAADLNLDILRLTAETKKIKGLSNDTKSSTTNNAIFVGSTASLLKHLEKLK